VTVRTLLLALVLSGCRTTVVEVQVYVTGDQGEPLDTGLVTAPLDDTADSGTTQAVPTATPQDLLSIDADAGLAQVHPNPASASATGSTWTLPDVAGLALALGDLDGDGLDDLWGRDGAAKTMTVWLQDSEGGFHSEPAWDEFTNIAEVREVLIGDFDGDGAADLGSWVDESNLLHVFAGTGQGIDLLTVVDSTLAGVFEGAWLTADVDADGRDDVVRVSATQVAVWRSGSDGVDSAAWLSRDLASPIDLLVEWDGVYGADLARVDDTGVEVLPLGPSGWSDTAERWVGPVGTPLLAGVLGP